MHEALLARCNLERTDNMSTEQPSLTCRRCAYGVCRKIYTGGQDRVQCTNDKVFGKNGLDNDGAEQYEAAELHFGLDFGCIHFRV